MILTTGITLLLTLLGLVCAILIVYTFWNDESAKIMRYVGFVLCAIQLTITIINTSEFVYYVKNWMITNGVI